MIVTDSPHYVIIEPIVVKIHGHYIRVTSCTISVMTARDLGDGCVNDEGADLQGFRAEFHGAVSCALKPEQAAEQAYLMATSKARTVVSSRLR